MQSLHPDIDTAAAKARHADIRREAEHWRRTRTARSGWLYLRGCWLLCRLGHMLIWLGQRLEGYGSAAADPGMFFVCPRVPLSAKLTLCGFPLV